MDEHVKIVLPCANEGEWVRVTVDSLLGCTSYGSYEIVISANGDTRTDFSFLERPAYAGKVRLLRTEELLGVGSSLNVAVEPGDAAYYFFLDAHCLVERPDWLQGLVACMRERPDTSIIHPEVQSFTYDGAIGPGAPVDHERLYRRFSDYGICWAWAYDDPWHLANDLRSKVSEDAFEWMAVNGAAMFCRADTFHRLGMFDTEARGWFREGLDYCVRGWLLGYPTVIEPRVRILHLMKQKGDDYARLTVDMIHGCLRTVYKYFSPRRQSMAERIFRSHGLDDEVERALAKLRGGNWIEERARHLRERVHDDDWLLRKFYVHEAYYAGEDVRPLRLYFPEAILERARRASAGGEAK